MTKYFAHLAIAGTLSMLAVTAINAQESVCYRSAENRSTSDADLSACTREVQSGRYTGVNLAITYNNRGRLFLNRKEYDAAIADFNQAIRIDPRHADAFINRGNVHEARAEYDKALADYNLALQFNPKHPSAHLNRGIIYGHKREYDRAIEGYNEAMRLRPNWADAFTHRGNAYFDKGDYDRAIADYTEAGRLDPRDPLPYYNRGLSYLNKKDYDRAIADSSEAIRLRPNYADAFNNRGIAYLRKGDEDRAIADFSEAVAVDPKNTRARDNRADVYERRGDYDRAIADYSALIEIDANNANFWNSRCWSRAAANRDLERALTDCDRAIQLRKDYWSALDSRGFVYVRLSRFKDAIEDYDKRLNAEPRNSYSLFGRGIAKLRNGDKTGGDADIAAAKEVDPKIVETFEKLGVKP